MAEVVAGAFGITTFGLQIGKRLYELKQLYDCIKSAPEEIKTLLNECDRLNKVLTHNATLVNQIASILPANDVWLDCHRSCETALNGLNNITYDLEKRVVKSKVRGSIKTVFEKDEISKQKEQLRTAKDDLLLAMQCLNTYVYAHYCLSV